MSEKPAISVTMRRALEDKNLLGNVLAGDSWQSWRVLLIAAMGEPLTDEERAIFTKLTGRAHEPGAPVEEGWFIIGRRGGKSLAIAALAVFLAVFRPHKTLAPGETAIVLCLAMNTKQAQVVLGYVVGILESTPLLAPLIRTRNSESVELANGVSIEIRAASFRGTRGVTALAVICDEIAFWFNAEDGSVNASEDILAAVKPSLATTGGPLIAISSPYAQNGPMWNTYKSDIGPNGDPLILVAQGASWELNSTLPQKFFDRAYARDPISAAAEYGAQFRSDLESFVSREVIEACVQDGCFELPPRPDVDYVAFVDAAGGMGGGDSMTLAIAHGERRKPHDDSGEYVVAVLDAVREVRPPFSPESVVSEFVATLSAYGVGKVMGDRWGSGFVQESFTRRSIAYEPSERVKSEIYREMMPLLAARRVELLDHKRLTQQLLGLERRTGRGSGKDIIDHAPNAHDDIANAAAGALLAAANAFSGIGVWENLADGFANLRQRLYGY